MENQVRVSCEVLREDEKGVWCETQVQSLVGPTPTHVYRGQVNITDPDRKLRLANVLLNKVKTINWATLLEVVCEKVLADWRWGNPTINLRTMDPPAPGFHLVKPLLPFGESSVLFAAGGSGKSLLGLALAAIVSANARLPCGLSPSVQQRAMYLDWETSEAEQWTRLRAIAQGLEVPTPDVYYRGLYRPFAGEAKRIAQEVKRYNIGFLVIDSLAAAVGANPNEPEPNIAFFNALRGLGTDVTKLVIAHTSKASAQADSGRGTPFGSAFIEYYARSVWEIRRSEGEGDDITVGLFHTKVNRGAKAQPFGVRLRFQYDPDATFFESYDLADDPTLSAYAPLSFRLRAALRSGRKSTESLASELNVKEAAVLGTLRRMKGITVLNPRQALGATTLWGLAAY